MEELMIDHGCTVKIDMATRQLCKGQDYVEHGHGFDTETGEKFDWALLNDGHGSHSCIQFIRDIPKEKKAELIGTTCPVEAFAEYIDQSGCVGKDESSGATVVIVKFYSHCAVCFSSGDSRVAVFKDGVLEYLSKEHNCYNPEEVDRLKAKGFSISTTPDTNSKMVAKNQLAVADSVYAVFPGKEAGGRMLACTQALGHNSLTGYAPEIKSIIYSTGSSYRFVLGSDGFMDMHIWDSPEDIEDMCTKSANQLCCRGASRWMQTWAVMQPDGTMAFTRYEENMYDDVAVVVVDVTPM